MKSFILVTVIFICGCSKTSVHEKYIKAYEEDLLDRIIWNLESEKLNKWESQFVSECQITYWIVSREKIFELMGVLCADVYLLHIIGEKECVDNSCTRWFKHIFSREKEIHISLNDNQKTRVKKLFKRINVSDYARHSGYESTELKYLERVVGEDVADR